MTSHSRLARMRASGFDRFQSVRKTCFYFHFTLLTLVAAQLCAPASCSPSSSSLSTSRDSFSSSSLYGLCKKSSFHCMGLSERQSQSEDDPTVDCVQSKNCLVLFQTQLLTRNQAKFDLPDENSHQHAARYCFYYDESRHSANMIDSIHTTAANGSSSTPNTVNIYRERTSYVLVGVRMMLDVAKPSMDILCGFQRQDRPQQSQIVYFYPQESNNLTLPVERERFVPGVAPIYTEGGRWANDDDESGERKSIDELNDVFDDRRTKQALSRTRYCCFEQPFELSVEHSTRKWPLILNPKKLQAHLFYRKNGHKLTNRNENTFSLQEEEEEEKEEEVKPEVNTVNPIIAQASSEEVKPSDHQTTTSTIIPTTSSQSLKTTTDTFVLSASTTTITSPSLSSTIANMTRTTANTNHTSASTSSVHSQPEVPTGNWDFRKTLALLFISFVLMCFLLIIAVTLYNLFINS